MKKDDDRIPLLLKADADELGGMACLPAPHSILWKGKMRASRKWRQRVVAMIALTEIIGGSTVVLMFVRMVWTTLLNTPASAHTLTIVVAAVLTLVAIVIIATGPFIAVWPRSG